MKTRIILVWLVIVWSAGLPLFAQSTGRLMGSVKDPSGAAVPGATIELLLPGGSSPLFSANTTDEGYFTLIGIRPDTYDLVIRATGFRSYQGRSVKIDPAREISLPAVVLEIGAVAEVVDVTATTSGVQTTNAELSTTITQPQVRDLPVLDRQMISLVKTQAGVSDARGFTTINGLRTSTANVTLDGINVQDNFFRRNALDYIPNRPTVDQVAELTVVTSNANATVGGGVSHVTMVTPSGQNVYHGTAFWYNRNSKFAANDWFANSDGLPNPFLNQNQAGGSLGGALIKDKLLFYGMYEALRRSQQSAQNRSILTESARQGLFTFKANDGSIRQVNVLQAAGVNGLDPTIRQILEEVPDPGSINNFRLGDSSSAFLRNTAGYSFLQRSNTNRNNLTGKLDYIASPKHVISGTYLWNNEFIDRGDVQNDSAVSFNGFRTLPAIYNELKQNFVSVGWRWSPAARFTNELRGGFNYSSVPFLSTDPKPEFQLGGLVFSNPSVNFLPNGRDVHTYNLMNNASWMTGKHNVQFGFTLQPIRLTNWNELMTVPRYMIGIGPSNPAALTGSHLPGASAADLTAANNLLASLAGYITSYTQLFNVTSRDSGYVPGAGSRQHLGLTSYAFYAHDTWRVKPRLSLNFGLRWEPYLPVDERDALALMPVVAGANPLEVFQSNATLDFAGSAVGRPWYRSDYNNFAPNVGLAWDVFGDGKTSLRAGYSVSFINDNTIATLNNNLVTNRGLFTLVTQTGLNASIQNGLPAVPAPTFQMPTTFADQYAITRSASFGMPDPGLATPYVQQWNLSVQREIAGTVFEVRYVANKATKLYRGIDFNQVNIHANGFYEDFLRAYNNGNLSRAQTGSFNPMYDPAVAGSQPLTVFSQLPSFGHIAAGNRGLVERGEVGELASSLQQTRLNGPINFFPNPYALATNMITNYSNSNYHSVQLDVTRRLSHGLQIQGNYVFGKVLSDSGTETNEQLEAFLDMNNPSVERARATFDLTHAIKANGLWQIPVGPGHTLHYRPLDRILGGWTLGGNLTWQSGFPFSVFSQRATVNRAVRSTVNTASTNANKDQLDDLFQLRMTGDGPMFISQSALNPVDGRAVNADGSAPFPGQVFFHPGPGQIGGLQRRMFSGPWNFNLDLSVIKRVQIGEAKSLELRMEAFNATNTPSWSVNDQFLNSTTFGQIVGVTFDRRLVQFGAYFRF